MRLAAVATALYLAASAASAADPAADVRKPTEIAAQRLETALQVLARERNVQVITRTEVVGDLRTDGASGELSFDEALEKLLSGTGLTYRYLNANTITIVRASVPPQGSVDKTQILEEVVVTGTNIRGVQATASPLQVFEREAIDRAGYATVQDFIAKLPQNLDFSENSANGIAGNAGNVGGASTINIRGLGTSSTLVLVNGRRLASGGGFGSFVDISLIPLTAVERIEVLTDGASAVYGSDAVGGVVNFVLRKDFEGAETRLRAGGVTEGGSQEYQVGQTFGHNWDSGNALLSYEYYQRNNLLASERSYTRLAPDPTDLLPKQERNSALFTGRQSVSDRVDVFTDLAFSKRQTDGFDTSTTRNALVSSEATEISATLGASTRLSDTWRLETTGSYSSNEADTTEAAGATLVTDKDSKFKLWGGEIRADGAVFDTPGGSAKLALGTSYRREDFGSVSKLATRTVTIDIDRDVFAAYGELFFPLVGAPNARPGLKALELTVAGRYERYSDFGSSTNPKIGLRWAPTADLGIRGTYGTSFRAPSFMNLVGDSSYIAFPASYFASGGALAPTTTLVLFGTNRDLQPEKAHTWTAGFDFAPAFAPGLDLKVTYFDLDYKDRIGVAAGGSSFFSVFVRPAEVGSYLQLAPDAATVAGYYASPYMSNVLGVPPASVGAIMDNRYQNLAVTKLRGIDLTAGYSTGELSFGLNASYLIEFINQQTPVAPGVDVLNTLFRPVDLRMRGHVGWSHGNFGATLFVNYVNDYTSDATGRVVPVDSWTTADLNLSYDIPKDSGTRWLSGTRWSLNVVNLTNADPPFVDNAIGWHVNFDGVNANALGRFISAQVTKRW